MKEYAKIILHAYPLLKTVGQDYEQHIRNKAVLSYKGSCAAEKLAEYLAGEILEMRRLEWLKGKVEEALEKLSEEQRGLLGARYFGKKSVLREELTERTYFRRLKSAEEKIASLLTVSGLNEKAYEEELAGIGLIARVAKRVRKR